MSTRSCLISQPKNKLISNNEQLFNTTDLSSITVGVNLSLNTRSKNSMNSQISPRTMDEKKKFESTYYQNIIR